MVFEIGEKAVGTPKQVPEDTIIEPGKIYRAVVIFEKEITDEQAVDALEEALRSIKSDYPGINISYVKVDGKNVYVELYDDPPGVSIGTIIALIILAFVTFGLAVVTKYIYEIILQVTPPGRPPNWFWYVLAIVGVGVGISLLGYGIYRIVRSVR